MQNVDVSSQDGGPTETANVHFEISTEVGWETVYVTHNGLRLAELIGDAAGATRWQVVSWSRDEPTYRQSCDGPFAVFPAVFARRDTGAHVEGVIEVWAPSIRETQPEDSDTVLPSAR